MSRAGEGEAEVVLQRINARLATWNAIHDGDGPAISLSVGYSLLTHTRELIEVMSEADLRMYEANRQRQNLLRPV